MFFGERVPYTNFHDLNLDEIIATIQKLITDYPDIVTELEKLIPWPESGKGAAGQLLESLGNGSTEWVNLDDIQPELIGAAVDEWLEAHPEATTTVQDNSISEEKLTEELRETIKAHDLVDTLKLRTGAFISSCISGLTSAQGMCCVDNRYLIVCRYRGTNERVFRVYDIINKSFLTESSLTSDQVGHVNSMTYYENHLYVTALEDGKGVIKLNLDPNTFKVTYDSIALETYSAACTIYNGNVYAINYNYDNDNWSVNQYNLAFMNPVKLFDTTFNNNMTHISIQGMTADENNIYISISGDYSNGASSSDMTNRLTRYTEYIFVYDKDGNFMKVYDFSRGVYNEIEDIDIININNQEYIAIVFNRDINQCSNVYVAPLYRYTQPENLFYTTDICNSIVPMESHNYIYSVYISEQYGSEFGDGTEGKPFNSIAAAISYILRSDVAARIIIQDGYTSSLFIEGCKLPLQFIFNGGTIDSIHLKRCNNITFDKYSGDGTTCHYMVFDECSIHSRITCKMVAQSAYPIGITLVRSLFIGSLSEEGSEGYRTALIAANKSLVCATANYPTGTLIQPGATLHGWINDQLY